jgi:nucleotide-binding universal stress UspA family protein
MLTIKTILHPTDFSAHSDCAFRLACSLARDHGARVVALHIVTPTVLASPEGVAFPPTGADEDRAQEQLNGLQASERGVAVERRLVHGDVPEEILRVAEQTLCELIVMGTHGRTGLGRLIMGSVAEQVLRKASCPVLTVKAPPRQQPSESPVLLAAGQGAERSR